MELKTRNIMQDVYEKKIENITRIVTRLSHFEIQFVFLDKKKIKLYIIQK